MAILKKLFPVLLLPFITACEEVFTPDMPHKAVLCINSLITSGEPINIETSKSRLYTETSEKSEVNDADIRIYANGKLQLDSYIPHEGDSIMIVAESPSVGRGEAEVAIPFAISTPTATWEVIDLEMQESNYGIISCQFKLKIELKIEDPEGENYYRFTYDNSTKPDDETEGFKASGNYGFGIGSFQYDMEPIFSEHIGIFESLMGGDSEGVSFFSDRQFSGKDYTLHLVYDNCWARFPKKEIPKCDLNLIINTISPSYYNWANYKWQRDNGTLSELSDYGLGDVIWGYSNVSTGAGVVAAQTKTIYTINITDYFKNLLNLQ